MPRNILIVDDDARVRASLSRVLASGPGRVRVAESAEAALSSFAGDGTDPVDLVISDVRMPGMDGLGLLRLLKERRPEVDVLLMTAYEDLPTVATAMREGAADFLVKPLDLHQLRAVVERVFRDRSARRRSAGASGGRAGRAGPVSSSAAAGSLVGRDPRMLEIFKLIGQLSASRATVVIRGESGTGKEVIARAIHATSSSADEPFVAVNCTALPATLLESELFGHRKGSFTGATADRKGRFELAGAGTIFLDEIGDTTPDFQAKLLRVLQEQEFYPVGAEQPRRTEARVMAATHRDLEALVAAGDFRQDLYYRLRVVEVRVPPLRERPEDIPALAEHLVARAAGKAGRPAPLLSDEAREALLAQPWPGNVRELENCLMRAAVLTTGDVIRPEDLGLGGAGSRADGATRLVPLEEIEAEHVGRVLAATGGNRTRAAEILGVSRPRLRRLIDRHGLE